MSIDPDSGAELPEDMESPFPDPGETAKDHDAQAAGRVAMQYSDKARFMATVALHAEAAQGIEDCAVTIPPLDDPALATGKNLDVTGELVGQSRVLTSGTELSDSTYRLLIAARIVRNSGKATSPELIAFLEDIVFGSTAFRFYDAGGMVVGIEVDGAPNADQKALIKNGPIPKAAGVGFIKGWYTAARFFGFEEDTRPGRRGFGLASDPDTGGYWGMLF